MPRRKGLAGDETVRNHGDTNGQNGRKTLQVEKYTQKHDFVLT